MTDPIELRKQVRRVLASSPDLRPISVEYIVAACVRFFPEAPRLAEIILALRWNEARGYAERRYDSDEERDEWLLSETGKVKEGVA